jgi:hypothetical protein
LLKINGNVLDSMRIEGVEEWRSGGWRIAGVEEWRSGGVEECEGVQECRSG